MGRSLLDQIAMKIAVGITAALCVSACTSQVQTNSRDGANVVQIDDPAVRRHVHTTMPLESGRLDGLVVFYNSRKLSEQQVGEGMSGFCAQSGKRPVRGDRPTRSASAKGQNGELVLLDYFAVRCV